MKHTPGPWRFERVIRGSNSQNDWLAIHPPHFYFAGKQISKVDEANAHLISAAPDLLEACKKTLKLINNLEYESWQIKYITLLKQAIAKAAPQCPKLA